MFDTAVLAAPLTDSRQAVALFRPTLSLGPEQSTRAAFLTEALELIAIRFVTLEPGCTLTQHISDLAREAFAFRAHSIIVARALFPGETLELDDQKAACGPVMKSALTMFGITLRDCLIIGDDGYLSMADSGVL